MPGALATASREDRDRGGDEVALVDEIAAEHLATELAGLDVADEAVALHGLPVGAVVGEDLLRERPGGRMRCARPARLRGQPVGDVVPEPG